MLEQLWTVIANAFDRRLLWSGFSFGLSKRTLMVGEASKMTETGGGGNKRVSPRQRVLKSAKIITPDRLVVTDCSIKNISETGALVVVSDPISIPKDFIFLITAESKMCQAQVVWRRDKQIGMTFTSPMTEPDEDLAKYTVKIHHLR